MAEPEQTSELEQTVSLARVRDLVRSGMARTIREGAGLSLGEVARASGISVSTVWRYEHLERVPTGEPALRYKALLDALVGRRV